MSTSLSFTSNTDFITDSSSAMMGEFGFVQELQEQPHLTKPLDKLKLFFDRWNGVISYPENLLELEKDNILILPSRLSDRLFGRDMLDAWIRNKSQDAPSIERVREITANLPSLTKLLLEERNNE